MFNIKNISTAYDTKDFNINFTTATNAGKFVTKGNALVQFSSANISDPNATLYLNISEVDTVNMVESSTLASDVAHLGVAIRPGAFARTLW